MGIATFQFKEKLMCQKQMTILDRDAFNQMVIEQIDTSGSRYEVQCPSCGESATERVFEAYYTGSVNTYESINCHHCSYHSCDVDGCSICDDIQSNEPDGWYESQAVFDMKNELLQQIKSKGFCDGKAWSSLKLYIHTNPSLIEWYDTVYLDSRCQVSTVSSFIKLIQKWLLNERFNYWLNLRIEAYKY